ncbi:Putative Zn-dependent protease [Limimonas halophila]|uniref:Putative Zn-dependent protease n=1 Tax=Limimonas halophila TaxID=1082479 RepID=A0A1G7RJ44_9PROT|nr:M48 family metalloprotease [Limimonas halophila]SDG10793.1 Putative Zn-dependent protease [Limimonas halophila]
MTGTIRRTAAGLAAAALLAANAGCTTAPATGETIFTGGMGADQAKKIGARQHPQILRQFGGEYENRALTTYVSSVGELLAQTSEEPDKDWTFTVLDTPVPNAFALPGGYIYITRGLLAITENEAQLAGVLGHEIGHVTARHSAARYGGNVLGQVAGVAAGVFLGRAGAQAANVLGAVALSSYSRQQEFEADKLGVRYATRGGFQADGMAQLLERMQAKSELDAKLQGREPRDGFSLLATHPRTPERVREAMAAADKKPVQSPIVGRDVFLSKLDGMVYGHTAEQGFIRRHEFLHPKLKLAFEVPEAFRLFNSAERVLAFGPEDSVIIFDSGGPKASSDPVDHLQNQWTSGRRLSDVEEITVNGMPAATGSTRVNTQQGTRDARFVAIRYSPTQIYRFLFLTPPELTGRFNEDFRRTTHSFRKLTDAEAAELKPKRIQVHTVREGETVESLAERMPYPDFKLERFRVLNGLQPGDTLSPGEKVKLVAPGPGA